MNLLLLLRPFPARERMARALYRAQRELQVRSLILGFRPKERSEFVAPFIVAGEPHPLDPNALPGARPARPRLPTAVTDGAVSVGWRGETQWGIWFHSERPVLLERVAPTLMWASARCFFPLRHVTHPRESLGEGDDAYAVQVAREFVYDGFATLREFRGQAIRWTRDAAPHVARGIMDPPRLPRALVGLSDSFSGRARYWAALETARVAYEAAVLLVDAEAGSEAAQRLGRAYRFLSQWQEAERWYMQATLLADGVGRLDLAAVAYDGYGNVALMRGANPEARARYRRALALGEASGSALAIARASHSLMLLDTDAGAYAAAMNHGVRAAQLHPSQEERAWALLGLVEVFIRNGNLDEAERTLGAVEALASDRERCAIARMDRARVLACRGAEGAVRKELLRIDRKGLSAHTLGQLALHEAEALLALRDWAGARRAAKSAIAIGREAGVAEYEVRGSLLSDQAASRTASATTQGPITEAVRNGLPLLV